MIQLIAISGDGIGAGKSTFASKIGDTVFSLAGALRGELARKHPNYDWFNKSQAYKDKTHVPEYRGLETNQLYTVRHALIEYGQIKCEDDPQYWAKVLAEKIAKEENIVTGNVKIAIDDVRKVCEIELLKERFGSKVLHFHMTTSTAIHEPHFDNLRLAAMADYVVRWQK